MSRRICILQGHPHGTQGHLCHALADAYAAGAARGGHAVTRLDVARIGPEPLRDPADFATPPEGEMEAARAAVAACEHLVIVFPLWLGGMPALLRAFFEQMARAQFCIGPSTGGRWPEQRLKGRSAHVIVTMGMPAFVFRLWYLNGGVAALKRMILGMSGVAPVRQTTIGGVEALSDAARGRHLARIEALGVKGL